MVRHTPSRAFRGHRRAVVVTALLAAASLALAACGGSDSAVSASGKKLTTVTFALGYIPAPGHNGLAYAIDAGLFEKQGIKVKILPFSGATTESLVAAGTADTGFGGGIATSLPAFATGSTSMKSIFAAMGHDNTYVTALASSGITSPKQFPGKVYGGYGSPQELGNLATMIKADGGTGQVKSIVLSVGSTEALKAKQVDLAVTYPDQRYEFDKAGVKYTDINPRDFGVPDSEGFNVLAGNGWLSKHPDLAKGFVAAIQEGYEKAIDDPAAANKALVSVFPELSGNADLIKYVGDVNAKEGFPNTEGLPVGTQDVDLWKQNAAYLAKDGLLTDADGKKLTSFDPSPFVTNEYLPAS